MKDAAHAGGDVQCYVAEGKEVKGEGKGDSEKERKDDKGDCKAGGGEREIVGGKGKVKKRGAKDRSKGGGDLVLEDKGKPDADTTKKTESWHKTDEASTADGGGRGGVKVEDKALLKGAGSKGDRKRAREEVGGEVKEEEIEGGGGGGVAEVAAKGKGIKRAKVNVNYTTPATPSVEPAHRPGCCLFPFLYRTTSICLWGGYD